MHFWLTTPLAMQLANGRVSERQGMLYFLVSTLLILVQTHYALWWGPRSGWLFHFELLALTVIAVVGCFQCWRVNGGREFVFRAICLSVPAGVQVFVLSLAFGLMLDLLAVSLFDRTIFRDPARAYSIFSYAAFIGFSIYFWRLLYTGMAIAARTEANHAPAT